MKIKTLECFCDDPHDARFYVRIGDSGCIAIDKNGDVYPDDGADDDFQSKEDVIKAFKITGIDDTEVYGYCPEYQDESGLRVTFEDGTVLAGHENENKEAFIKAFENILFFRK